MEGEPDLQVLFEKGAEIKLKNIIFFKLKVRSNIKTQTNRNFFKNTNNFSAMSKVLKMGAIPSYTE
jgi:hypothetical protein